MIETQSKMNTAQIMGLSFTGLAATAAVVGTVYQITGGRKDVKALGEKINQVDAKIHQVERKADYAVGVAEAAAKDTAEIKAGIGELKAGLLNKKS